MRASPLRPDRGVSSHCQCPQEAPVWDALCQEKTLSSSRNTSLWNRASRADGVPRWLPAAERLLVTLSLRSLCFRLRAELPAGLNRRRSGLYFGVQGRRAARARRDRQVTSTESGVCTPSAPHRCLGTLHQAVLSRLRVTHRSPDQLRKVLSHTGRLRLPTSWTTCPKRFVMKHT